MGFDDNRVVNGSDLLTFGPVLLPLYKTRRDVNADGKVNGSDFFKLPPFAGKGCAPLCGNLAILELSFASET